MALVSLIIRTVYLITFIAIICSSGCTQLAAEPCAHSNCLQISDIVLNHSVSAQQIVQNGVPRRLTEVHIPFRAALTLSKPQALSIRVPILDPLKDTLQFRQPAIRNTRIHDNQLILQIDGPISRGVELSVDVGALSMEGQPIAAGTVRLTSARLLTPMQAALWLKPYTPISTAFYQATQQRAVQSNDLGTVAHDLRTLLLKRARSGRIEVREIETLMTRLYQQDGMPVHLKAAVLATAGTLFERVIPIILDGANRTGNPIVVDYQELCCDELARVYFSANPYRQYIFFHPTARFEPFALLATVLGHEAIFHQDTQVGQMEEIMANFAQYIAFAEQALADPALAKANTPLAKINSKGLLAILNSGWYFPNPGIGSAPAVIQVLPGHRYVTANNFRTALSLGYREVANRATPGNTDVDRIMSKLLNRPIAGFQFSHATLNAFDAEFGYFTPEQIFELLRLFQLRPAF